MRRNVMTGVALAALGLLVVAGLAAPALTAGTAPGDEVIVPFFGNEKCPISGKAVDSTKVLTVDGQNVYYCCGNCLKKAKEDPAAALAKAYPERKKLGGEKCAMIGKEVVPEKKVVVDYQAYEVTLCCKNCEKKFKENPTAALVKMLYPKATFVNNKRCPVMTEEEAMPDVLAIYKDQVVAFCCPDCIKDFKADPEKILAAAKKGG